MRLHCRYNVVIALAQPHWGAAGRREVYFPDWNNLNKQQCDIFLNELWSMGMREEALFLARMHLKVSLKKSEGAIRARFEKG